MKFELLEKNWRELELRNCFLSNNRSENKFYFFLTKNLLRKRCDKLLECEIMGFRNIRKILNLMNLTFYFYSI